MKLKGLQTVTKQVEVEVSLYELRDSVLSVFYNKHPQFRDGSHIDSRGHWRISDGYDYHKGDSVFKHGDKASEADVERQKFLDKLWEMFN